MTASAQFTAFLETLRLRIAAAQVPGSAERGDSIVPIVPLASDVSVEQLSLGGLAAELIVPAGADSHETVLYLHGGGYVGCSINTHRELAARIATSARCRALIIEYRLAPAHPFPAAIDDACAAYRWLLEQGIDPASIVIAGDSAGGGLAMATLLALREADVPLPVGAVLISPWVDLELAGDSAVTRAELDPLLTVEGLRAMAAAYLNGADPRAALASPIHADLAGLPPLYVLVGSCEVLYDDAIRLVERARQDGVEARLDTWEDMIHVWPLFPEYPEAHDATDRIGEFIRPLLSRAHEDQKRSSSE